jgi:hypothetical protein
MNPLPFMAAENEKNVNYEIQGGADDSNDENVASDSSHDEQDDNGDDGEAGVDDHADHAEDLDTFDVRKYMLNILLISTFNKLTKPNLSPRILKPLLLKIYFESIDGHRVVERGEGM